MAIFSIVDGWPSTTVTDGTQVCCNVCVRIAPITITPKNNFQKCDLPRLVVACSDSTAITPVQKNKKVNSQTKFKVNKTTKCDLLEHKSDWPSSLYYVD